jgi:hypothetical protein
MSNDIIAMKNKWSELSVDLNAKEGKVSDDDFPLFYLIYEEYICLGDQMHTVLTPNAVILQQLADGIITEANRQIEEYSKAMQDGLSNEQ